MSVRAIERCAYCERHVPVTWIDVAPSDKWSAITARVAVCEDCHGDGR